MTTTREPLGIYLTPVKSTRDIENMIDLLQDEEVWKNLEWDVPPEMDPAYHAELVFGLWAGRFIHSADDDRVIGAVILDTKRLKTEGVVELDIAITDTAVRKKSLSTRAMALVFDEYLLGEKSHTVWGWIDARNTSSVRMVESMGLPIVGIQKGVRTMVDGPVDSVEVVLKREDWDRIRPNVRDHLGLPDWPHEGGRPPSDRSS